jgi:hypothetical protein
LDSHCLPTKFMSTIVFLSSRLVIRTSSDGMPLSLIELGVLLFLLQFLVRSLFTICLPWRSLRRSSKLSIAGAVLFFWTGDDACHGSKCLVAWENVQDRKEYSGLGVKNLEL